MIYKKTLKSVKVLIVVKSIDGGTGTFLIDLLKINKLSFSKDIRIKILALERPVYRNVVSTDFTFLIGREFYPQRYSLSPINFFNFLKELIWIKKEAEKFKPDIIMGVDLRCNMLAIASKLLFLSNVKSIASSHINLAALTLDISKGIIRNLLKTSIRLIYEQADVLICVSKGITSHLRKDFHIMRDIQTIYYGKDFIFGKQRKFPKKEKIIVVSVARLSIQKDYENLINAFSLVDKCNSNLELWIAGDGPERQKLKKLVQKLGLMDKIKFLGWVGDTKKLYDRSDIFVLSSKSEGFGYVLIEAMARGLPVISTDAPFGPREVLKNGKYGIIVPVSNANQMKRSIIQLSTNINLYENFSKKSLIRSKYFSELRMQKKYIKVFRQLKNYEKT